MSLPKLWVTGPIYESRIAFLIDRIQPLSLPTLEQLPAIKECIKSAALFTRDTLNFTDSGGRECKRLTLESLSRAVWHNDCKLARKLLDTTTIAREHIDIVLGKIVVLNPPSFEEAYRVERQYYHSRQITDAKSQLPSAKLTEAAKLKGKIASARRQQTTFFGKKPFVNLKGLKIKRPNSIVEQIVTEPADIQRGLIG